MPSESSEMISGIVGGWGWAWGPGDEWSGWGIAGLVGLLVVIACVVLLFTGRYPPALFDFAVGLDRWALRVAAYVGLMTDDYPPFRLDMRPHEPDMERAPAAAAMCDGSQLPPTGPRRRAAGGA